MSLRVAIAQLNLLVGGVVHNAAKIRAAAQRARDELKAQVIVFPELALSGYPPEDLLLRADFLDLIERELAGLLAEISGITCVIGFPERHAGNLYNSAAVLHDSSILAVYRKHALPNYGVFDERRYFAVGHESCLFELCGVRIGLTICEDVWWPGIFETTARAGAQLIFNLNASPFHANKISAREQVLRERIDVAGVPAVYVNLLGGQDELVFDGASFVMDAKGQVCFRAPEFAEDVYLVEFDAETSLQPRTRNLAPLMDEVASVYQALVYGIRDYVCKNRFRGAVLGLSGGIDSALTLALAVDALGAAQVEVALMPSRYTADMSNEDAVLEAHALGVKYHILPIEPAFQTFLDILRDPFAGLPADTSEENIQARCRGVLLMALSNKTGKILLTTGNKSEMSVGYCTLYGDMAGGFAPLKDVPKMLVYRLCEYRNGIAPVIPQRVLERPPSAELRPDQKDEDSLPPYPVLDAILLRYVEQDWSIQNIIDAGYSEDQVRRVVRLVDLNEYKRRQAPPGVKITPRAFGRDRRYPLTSGFRI